MSEPLPLRINVKDPSSIGDKPGSITAGVCLANS